MISEFPLSTVTLDAQKIRKEELGTALIYFCGNWEFEKIVLGINLCNPHESSWQKYHRFHSPQHETLLTKVFKMVWDGMKH